MPGNIWRNSEESQEKTLKVEHGSRMAWAIASRRTDLHRQRRRRHTGTIQLKATFPNTDNALWPGQFVQVTLTLKSLPQVTVVPSQAVQAGQNGDFVYVVKADQTVEARPVLTAMAIEGGTVVTNGLKAGRRSFLTDNCGSVPAQSQRQDAGETGNDNAALAAEAMNVAQPFINRPVMTTLVMSAILLFGIVAHRFLPVSDLPSVDYPTIQVSANLPGASPETMAAAVATPLEKQFSTIAGIDSMTSVSALGNSRITIQFSLDRDIDAAAQDVQSAISKASRQLPPGMPTPPTFNKVNPADSPILYLSLTSATLPLSKVDEYAENLVAQRISMVNGVAQVGQRLASLRVHQLDPSALASRGIGIKKCATLFPPRM